MHKQKQMSCFSRFQQHSRPPDPSDRCGIEGKKEGLGNGCVTPAIPAQPSSLALLFLQPLTARSLNTPVSNKSTIAIMCLATSTLSLREFTYYTYSLLPPVPGCVSKGTRKPNQTTGRFPKIKKHPSYLPHPN